jgi:hypothetical protein
MQSDPNFSFRQSWNDRIELAQGAESASAVYQYSSKLPKPCVCPLFTPAGHQLGGFEMSDHVWHRGLWFTIKFINGSNFWEERPPFGVQVSQAQPLCKLIEPQTIQIAQSLDWNAEATGTVFCEKRTLVFRPGSIDWSTELAAAQDLTLDRTPYTTWGGYGGLAFRGARELHGANYLVPSGEAKPALIGERHDWAVLQAKVDHGVDQRVSLGMIDHPANPRGQSPWYCKAENGYILMNAAFLFHEPMAVKKGEILRFRYRIHYRDGLWQPAEFAALARAFREEP